MCARPRAVFVQARAASAEERRAGSDEDPFVKDFQGVAETGGTNKLTVCSRRNAG